MSQPNLEIFIKSCNFPGLMCFENLRCKSYTNLLISGPFYTWSIKPALKQCNLSEYYDQHCRVEIRNPANKKTGYSSAEAVFQGCSVEKVFLEISKNSLENTCARVSFLIKLHAWGLQETLAQRDSERSK